MTVTEYVAAATTENKRMKQTILYLQSRLRYNKLLITSPETLLLSYNPY